jgi:hypothetical protein
MATEAIASSSCSASPSASAGGNAPSSIARRELRNDPCELRRARTGVGDHLGRPDGLRVASQRFGHRRVRERCVLVAAPVQDHRAVTVRRGAQLGEQAALADAGLATDQDTAQGSVVQDRRQRSRAP